jgi:hypothetical protein
MKKPQENTSAPPAAAGLLTQGYLSIALFMTLGLALEGMIGLKSPAYLGDPLRRELFTLAHTHGALFGLLLVAAGLTLRAFGLELPRSALAALRIGSLLMPAAFFVSGISHPEGDPGPAIWLAPAGGVLMIYGVIVLGLQVREHRGKAVRS